MKVIKTVFQLGVITLLVGIATSAYAVNRNDVFSELEKINTSWDDISIDL